MTSFTVTRMELPSGFVCLSPDSVFSPPGGPTVVVVSLVPGFAESLELDFVESLEPDLPELLDLPNSWAETVGFAGIDSCAEREESRNAPRTTAAAARAVVQKCMKGLPFWIIRDGDARYRTRFRRVVLPLHSPGSAARYECVYLRLVEAVKVTGNRVLQAGCRHSKLQSLVGCFITAHGIDKARCEGVARSHPVDDVRDFVLFTEKELTARMEAGRPAIMGRAL